MEGCLRCWLMQLLVLGLWVGQKLELGLVGVLV